MRAFAASVEEVFREAAARWTLIAYFALSSLFILIFARGREPRHRRRRARRREALRPVRRPRATGKVDIDKLVLGFESGFSGFLYLVGTFLALFATAHLVPRLQEKGTIDLYLSRPVGRVPLLLSRYAGGLLLAGANVLYLIGSMWLIVVWKTHVFHPRFLLSGGRHPLHDRDAPGVRVPRRRRRRRRPASSLMATYAIFFFAAILVGARPDRGRRLDGVRGAASSTASTGCFRRPRSSGRPTVALVAGKEAPGAPRRHQPPRGLRLDGALRRRRARPRLVALFQKGLLT